MLSANHIYIFSNMSDDSNTSFEVSVVRHRGEEQSVILEETHPSRENAITAAKYLSVGHRAKIWDFSYIETNE